MSFVGQSEGAQMSTEFKMPKLGLTMEAGIILEWLVADGDEVRQGQPVLLIETDKVESEVESSGSGRLQQVGAIGESYSCGAVIGWLLDPGEEEATDAPPAESAAIADVAVASVAGVAIRNLDLATDKRIIISPNARRLAKELGVDLARVSGSGSGGRIVAKDIELVAGLEKGQQSAPALSSDVVVEALLTESPEGLLQRPSAVFPMRGMRGTIAKRMHASLHEMAQLTLTVEVMMDAVVKDREQRKAGGPPPSYTDYVIAVVAIALTRHPIINSQVTEEGVALLPGVNVGMAVAVDDGLIVPVVHDAPALALSDLAAETSRLTKAARDSKLSLLDLEGGTFSVTSLGMFGVDAFTPVINPPNTAILGIGGLRDAIAWSNGGEPLQRSALTLSLTWDHRAFDGVPAASFAAEVRDLLEVGVFLG
jgi:pyruvate/2-oxoglutarate dehydrogenase complex dihydrolipoamide acyltransferase (E2) component